MQNDKITAKITFLTQGFDEYGVRYSLAKYYGKPISQFSYKDLKDKNKKRNIFGLLEMCAFLVHLVSGMGYFANMFAGNSYY